MVYTILDSNWNILESFTFHGIVEEETIDSNGEEYTRTYNRGTELESNGVTRETIVATKNIFTSDNKWTVFISEKEGYCLYDEDGNRLGLLPLDGARGEIWFRDVKNTQPFFFTIRNNTMTVWDFKGNSAGAYSPQVRTVLSGYPNPLPKGETFTVELPKVSDGRTVVVVTDMSGRQVYRDGVAQGQETVRITPDSVAEGMLIYTVIYGDGETVSGRLIAK